MVDLVHKLKALANALILIYRFQLIDTYLKETKHQELIDIEKDIAILSQTQTRANIADLEKQYSEKQTKQLEAAAKLANNIDKSSMQFEKIKAIYNFGNIKNTLYRLRGYGKCSLYE